MTIRQMTESDWEYVSDIYKQGIDTGLATFQSEIPSYEAWDKSHVDFCRLVAELDGKIVGWTALSAVSSRCVYSGVCEVSIYIGDNARGKGVGSILLKTLVEESRKFGIWTLQSSIMQENIVSIKLHEKCGFRMVGYRERIGKDITKKWRNNVLMEHRCKEDDISNGCVLLG